jgi:uncharacterized membrane protein
MEVKRYQKIIYIIVICVSLLWCAGVLVAPLWADDAGFKGSISESLYSFYSASCHQLDSRSFHLGEHRFGVCSRCTSIYLGFLIGVILYPFVRHLSNIDLPSLWFLFIGAALIIIDAGLDILDILKNTFVTREITGAILGLILPFYIIPGLVRIFYEFFNPRHLVQKNKIENNNQ